MDDPKVPLEPGVPTAAPSGSKLLVPQVVTDDTELNATIKVALEYTGSAFLLKDRPCDFCQKVFKAGEWLRVGKVTQTGVIVYVCDTCCDWGIK